MLATSCFNKTCKSYSHRPLWVHSNNQTNRNMNSKEHHQNSKSYCNLNTTYQKMSQPLYIHKRYSEKNVEVKTYCFIYLSTSHWNFCSFLFFAPICVSAMNKNIKIIEWIIWSWVLYSIPLPHYVYIHETGTWLIHGQQPIFYSNSAYFLASLLNFDLLKKILLTLVHQGTNNSNGKHWINANF